MYHCIIVTSRNNEFIDFAKGLMQHGDVAVTWKTSGKEVLEAIAGNSFDLAVADENLDDMTGLEFIRKLVAVNPVMNTAAVSRLSAGDFHEAGEGLGILFQLPRRPDEHHGREAMNLLKKVCFRLNKPDPSGKTENS